MDDKERPLGNLGQRILIVDDDEGICRSLTFIFRKTGYETETAGTGREAIEKAQGRLFNVALLDIRLPDMEGADEVESQVGKGTTFKVGLPISVG